MSTETRLNEVFQTVFLDDDLELSDDMTAADVDGWDSLAHINLMFAIEQEFGFQFPGNELAELPNIGALKAFIDSKTH
ncbi:MAG: acyl carrier protein [Alphaproteobacteria bacterium]|nr:acyl carrier protein [Alphaproteobacteria bacterium]|tara:strand:- start:460 stop:693 length:234 start_codon:yes stop_codon:yes gene_type:complete